MKGFSQLRLFRSPDYTIGADIEAIKKLRYEYNFQIYSSEGHIRMRQALLTEAGMLADRMSET